MDRNETNYLQCQECNEIIYYDDMSFICDEGYRDRSGFQHDPDVYESMCPECRCLESCESLDDYEMVEIIKDLKKEINDNENTIRNQRLKIQIMEEEDSKCEMIRRLEETIKLLKAELYMMQDIQE